MARLPGKVVTVLAVDIVLSVHVEVTVIPVAHDIVEIVGVDRGDALFQPSCQRFLVSSYLCCLFLIFVKLQLLSVWGMCVRGEGEWGEVRSHTFPSPHPPLSELPLRTYSSSMS